MSSGFRLRVCAGPDAGREFVVADPAAAPIAIGRTVDPERDFLCADTRVSRRHATIEVCSRGFLLMDAGSTNGTKHNGRLLEPGTPVLLRDGDELRFGPNTVVEFRLWSSAVERPTDETAPSRAGTAPSRGAPKAPDTPPSRGASRGRKQAAPSGPPVDQPPVAREQFGRYAVYDVLAESDSDRVEVALDTATGQRVALKRFVARQLSRNARRRVLDDATRGRRWRHPNIAEVLDAGEHGGTLFVASRLVEGVCVSELQARYAREIDIGLATYIAREVCAALAYAQGEVRGFVHRNLSPRTVLLGRSGEVVLINFGFVPVKVLLDSTVGLSRMEARYLSPEHRHGRGLEPRSDIFSVGVILYELLVQEPIDPRRKSSLPDVDTQRPEVSPPLAEVTMRAVALRPEQRFRSAGEMEEALSAELERLAPRAASDAARWVAERCPGFAVR